MLTGLNQQTWLRSLCIEFCSHGLTSFSGQPDHAECSSERLQPQLATVCWALLVANLHQKQQWERSMAPTQLWAWLNQNYIAVCFSQVPWYVTWVVVQSKDTWSSDASSFAIVDGENCDKQLWDSQGCCNLFGWFGVSQHCDLGCSSYDSAFYSKQKHCNIECTLHCYLVWGQYTHNYWQMYELGKWLTVVCNRAGGSHYPDATTRRLLFKPWWNNHILMRYWCYLLGTWDI